MTKETMTALLKCLAYTLNGKEWYGDAPQFVDIYALAQQQTVASFLVEAPHCVLGNFQKRERLQLAAEAFSLEQVHHWTNDFLCLIAKQMKVEGIRYCLLKGQNCAVRYPKPQRRNVGDIDLYIAPQDFDKAVTFFSSKGFCETEKTWLHLTLKNKEGFIVELHHTLQRMQWTPHNSAIKRFCEGITFDNYITINNQAICVLPPELDMIMLTIHPLTHLMGEGIGLRHVCDWMMRLKYISTENEYIDKQRLFEMLRSLHLIKLWRVLACICVSYLGMPMEMAFIKQGFTDDERKYADVVLDRICATGNFGTNLDLQKRRKKLMGRYSLFLSNSIRLRTLVPYEALATPFMKAIEGLQQRLYNSKTK